MTAGKRGRLVSFETAATVQDDYGEEVSAWNEQGQEWAEVHYGRGDERREAAMLQGKQPATFVVPDNTMTRTVGAKDRLVFLHEAGVWDIAANIPGNPGLREITATRAL